MRLRLVSLLFLAVEALSVPANETLWGAYRPNLYFGLRPRLPKSLMTGLIWFGTHDYQAAASEPDLLGPDFTPYQFPRTPPLV
jgi:mannosyl-oligosaccharide glucosidase